MLWDGDYHFFVHSYSLTDYAGQDYAPGKTIFLLFSIISITILLLVLRKVKKEKLSIYFKILAIAMPILEVLKITWESVWDIQHGLGFNAAQLLPLYTCSLILYCLTPAAFGKGKIKDSCLAWLASLGFASGLSFILFPRTLHWNPFFSFVAMYSLFFHYFLVLTALIIVVTRYKTFSFRDIGRAFLVNCCFSLLVIPIDYIWHWDYMQYYDAAGVPFIQDLVQSFAEKGLRFLAVPLMMLAYLILTVLFISLCVAYDRLTDRLSNKRKIKSAS